jgi:hypothetical protein
MSDVNQSRKSSDKAYDGHRRFHIALAWFLRVCGVSIICMWLLMLSRFPRQGNPLSFGDSRNINIFTAAMLFALSFLFAKARHTQIGLEALTIILAIAVVAISVAQLVVGNR